jgi:hypothetical protein
MHSRKTHLALSLILTTAAVALSSAAVFAKGPPRKNATTVDLLLPPGTPPCPELTEVTGIYQDGLGTYQYGAWVNGAFMFHPPPCVEGREIIALLPSEATSQMTPGEWATCSGFSLNTPMLIIHSLLSAPTGVVDPDAGYDGVKYAFHIDSDGDGQFETPANIFWHGGIHLTRTELTNPNRTVYSLTTELTSDYAEVRSAGVSIGTFCIPLRLTVTRLK